MLDAGLPRKEDPEDQKTDVWTAPSYFDITLGGLSDGFGAHPRAHALPQAQAAGASGCAAYSLLAACDLLRDVMSDIKGCQAEVPSSWGMSRTTSPEANHGRTQPG